MGKGYVIGGIFFKTKKDIVKWAQDLKKEVGKKYRYPDPGYLFLFDLIQRGHHHADEKIGVGIEYFLVGANNSGITRFDIYRVDGTSEDVSYIKSKDYLGRDRDEVISTNTWVNLMSAARWSIADQIANFRRATSIVCAECGEDDSSLRYEVDHKGTNFVELLVNFDRIRDDTPRVFLDAPFDHIIDEKPTHIFRTEDSYYEKSFKEYHRENAVLQLLCKPCNLKKSRSPGVVRGVWLSKGCIITEWKQRSSDGVP